MSRRLGLFSGLLRVPCPALAVVAVLCQLALGAVLPHGARAAISSDEALGALCIAGAPAHAPSHRNHRGDYALCPLCLSAAAQAVVVAAPPSLPLPRGEISSPVMLPPPARGPPAPPHLFAFPRGPPVLT